MKLLAGLGLLFLLLANGVLASQADFNVSADFNSSTSNGDGVPLGRMIVTRSPYIADNFSTASIVPMTIQRYDKFMWTGNGSISIRQGDTVIALLASGESFVFQNSASYVYFSNTNQSEISSIVVTEEDKPTVTITPSGGQLVILGPTSFVLDGPEKILNFSMNVNADLSPGVYNFSFLFSSPEKNLTTNHSATLVERKTWIILEQTLPSNITAKAGDATPIGEIKITNTGNMDFKVTSELIGNGTQFLQTQPEQTLFRKSTTMFSFTLLIPQKQPDGYYNTTLVFRGGDTQISVPVSILVTDKTLPTIKNVTFADDYVWHENTVTVEAIDNIDVMNVTINYDGNTYLMTKDNQIFTYIDTYKSINSYTFKICAYDSSNNVVCQDYQKQFLKLKAVNPPSDVAMPSRRYGKFSSEIAFNLTESLQDPIRVTLVDFTSDILTNDSNATQDNTFRVRLLDGDGAIKQLDAIGSMVEIVAPGQILLEVRSDRISSFDGVLHFEVPEYVEPVPDLRFHGKFLDYDIPNRFTREWFGKTFSCDVVDTGNVESSYYDCEIQFPISVDVQSLAIPTTPEEQMLQAQQHNATVTSLEGKIINRNISLTVLTSLVIVAIGLIIWVSKYHPIWRFRWSGWD